MEHQEGAGRRGSAKPHPAPPPRNRKAAPTGDRFGMGHRHSSAQFSGHGGTFVADGRPAEAASTSGPCPPVAREAPGIAGSARSAGASVLLLLVRFYIAFLSPFLGGACKFYPSCSQYAREAVAVHGARRGFILAMKRLGRCRPFTKGGFDPVPGAVFANADASASGNESQGRAWSQRSFGAAIARDGEKPAA